VHCLSPVVAKNLLLVTIIIFLNHIFPSAKKFCSRTS